MCGIILLFGNIKNIYKELIKSLRLLENRGYDSIGICSIKNKQFLYDKFIKTSNITPVNYLLDIKLENKYKNLKLFIGHTRWATHGIKSVRNAHPHFDYKNKFALIHNGIINNYIEIKNYLLSKNVVFTSDTDTEVIVNLISYNYHELFYSETNFNKRIEKSIQCSLNTLKGTFGVCLINLYDENSIYVFKNGSPITFFYNDKQLIIASEQNILQAFTNFYFECKNDKLYRFKINKIGNVISNIDINHKNIIKYEIEKCIMNDTPEPYKYWTMKEIFDIPFYYKLSLNNGARLYNNEIKLGGLFKFKNQIISKKNIIFLGCGSSLNAALYVSKNI